jgi:putative sigma-54 modulation protein
MCDLMVRSGHTPMRIRPAAQRGTAAPRGGASMQFQLSGQQIVVTPALRDHVTSKLDRLTRLDDRLISLAVVLSIDSLHQRADGTLTANGAVLHAQATEADMYASIDLLFDKLTAQLRKHRDKASDKHQRQTREERQYG